MLELSDLFDSTRPFSFNEVKRIFLAELGASPDKIFSLFEEKPFASASFAQVHGAKLNGQTVVVKIQRPGVKNLVVVDFILIDIFSYIADLFFKIEALPWREFAREFKEWTIKELDYHIEAEHMQRSYNAIQRQDIHSVVIPKIYHTLTTKRIIVQEYIDGIPLSRILRELRKGTLSAERLKKMGIDISKTPRLLIHELLREYFIDGYFHADPHPGNILLLKNNKIGIIDFGIVGQSAPNRVVFMKFLRAGARSRYDKSRDEEIGYYLLQFAGNDIKQLFASSLTATTEEKAIDDFMHLLATHFHQYYSEVEVQLRKDLNVMKKDYLTMILQMLRFVSRYKIRLPNEMAVFTRAISIIGFLAKELDYDFNMSSTILEFCREYPPEKLPHQDIDSIPYKRLSREHAIERINNWMTYLVEKDPSLYKLVATHIAGYNVLAK